MNGIQQLKQLFVVCMFVVCWQQAEAQQNHSRQGLHLPEHESSIQKPSKGDTLVYYQVLQLHTQHRKEYLMAVLAEATIETTTSRAKMKIDYMLKRERVYLSRIFFAKVRVLEQARVPAQRDAFLKQLESRFPDIQVWSVLHVNAYFQ